MGALQHIAVVGRDLRETGSLGVATGARPSERRRSARAGASERALEAAIEDESALGLQCFASRGHASHHVTYLDAGGVMYDGDTTGVRVPPFSYVTPATPPPDIDLELWAKALGELERRQPERLAIVHCGVFDDVNDHLRCQRVQLALTAERVRLGVTVEEFVAAAHADRIPEAEPAAATYALVGPASYNYYGLRRYWDRRLGRAGAGETART